MGAPRKTDLPPPSAHPPDSWLRLDEAAAYVRMSPEGLRSAVHRKAIKPDGRGPHRTHMFRAKTLDLYLSQRLQCYIADRHATAGDMESNDQKEGIGDALPRRVSTERRAVPTPLEGDVPEDGKGARTRADRGSKKRSGRSANAKRSSSSNNGRAVGQANEGRGILDLLADWQKEDAEAVDP